MHKVTAYVTVQMSTHRGTSQADEEPAAAYGLRCDRTHSVAVTLVGEFGLAAPPIFEIRRFLLDRGLHVRVSQRCA